MEPLSPRLAPHKGLRGQILLELKRRQPLTARELAEGHGVSTNAIRRHLKELEAEGMAGHTREQRGQGAPTFTYHLMAAGEALFPKRYDETLNEVLTFVAQMSGRDEVHRIFAQRFREEATRLNAELQDAGVEERVSVVVDLLSQQGFMAEWSVEDGSVHIAEHNCALQAAAERFPEICEAEVEFLRSVLGTEVERRAYIPDGCNACEYAVALGSADGPSDAVQPVPPQER